MKKTIIIGLIALIATMGCTKENTNTILDGKWLTDSITYTNYSVADSITTTSTDLTKFEFKFLLDLRGYILKEGLTSSNDLTPFTYLPAPIFKVNTETQHTSTTTELIDDNHFTMTEVFNLPLYTTTVKYFVTKY